MYSRFNKFCYQRIRHFCLLQSNVPRGNNRNTSATDRMAFALSKHNQQMVKPVSRAYRARRLTQRTSKFIGVVAFGQGSH